MAVRFYDDAITNKIKNWTKDNKLVVMSPNETRRLFEYRADVSNDNPIELPMIAISRKPSLQLINPHKQPLTFDAEVIGATEKQVISLSAIPIEVSYQLDIYTRYFEQCDEYVRNFVFNIVNYPTLKIELPYNGARFVHEAAIELASEIEDNSDIPERLITGQFTRYTMTLGVRDAYLFSVPIRDSLHVEAKIEVGFEDDFKNKDNFAEGDV